MARLLGERHVQGDEMARPQHIVDGGRAPHLRGQAPGGVHGDLRIEAEHVHAEPDRGVGHEAADFPQADDAQRLARQLAAGKGRLALFDLLVEVGRGRVQCAHEFERRNQVARRHQHPGDHQLLDRVGVRPRSVEHRHAGLGEFRHRDVVHPRAGPTDRLDVGAEVHAVQVLRAHQHRVRRLGLLDDRVALRRQALEADLGDLVQHQHLDLLLHALRHDAVRTPSGTRPDAARSRAASRCRSRRACRRPSGAPSAAPCRARPRP